MGFFQAKAWACSVLQLKSQPSGLGFVNEQKVLFQKLWLSWPNLLWGPHRSCDIFLRGIAHSWRNEEISVGRIQQSNSPCHPLIPPKLFLPDCLRRSQLHDEHNPHPPTLPRSFPVGLISLSSRDVHSMLETQISSSDTYRQVHSKIAVPLDKVIALCRLVQQVLILI